MSAFSNLDWRRIDVTAIVTFGGIVTIDVERREMCHDWLRNEGYAIDTLDFQPGLDEAIPAIGKLLDWEAKFGYRLNSSHRNLDAVRDGFEFDVPEDGGHVLEMIGLDLAWTEDQRWTCGLLQIAQEHCRACLALGRRFFVLIVVPKSSHLIGKQIDGVAIPPVFFDPCPKDSTR